MNWSELITINFSIVFENCGSRDIDWPVVWKIMFISIFINWNYSIFILPGNTSEKNERLQMCINGSTTNSIIFFTNIISISIWSVDQLLAQLSVIFSLFFFSTLPRKILFTFSITVFLTSPGKIISRQDREPWSWKVMQHLDCMQVEFIWRIIWLLGALGCIRAF